MTRPATRKAQLPSTEPAYIWDEERRLFRRDPSAPFPYTDGADVEQRLLTLMQSVKDKSVASLELSQAITDWPSEYHLSRFRHCLIRPLKLRPGERVLEVGAGCGAITRYLGELGAQVTAVEGSLSRAAITSQRCSDLPNVKVVNDDLVQFSTRERFDWLLLVGVLEYAPVFSTAAAPVQHYFSRLKEFLAPHGNLVVAIENKLGLKYFNACGEDHVGAPFFGIQDLYGPKTPRTFGRAELALELRSAGFPFTRFYYPFPDYKLPSVIVSDEALHTENFNPAELILRSRARDYTGRPFRLFNEALVYSSLADNGLFAEFANSFLVIANQASIPRPSDDLATTYAVGRRPEFATETRFFRRGEGILVGKQLLSSSSNHEALTGSGMRLRIDGTTTDYVAGRQIFFRFLSEQARSGSFEKLVAVLQPWLRFLLERATHADSGTAQDGERHLSSLIIDGSFLDCTPFNLLETGSGLVQIDREWSTDRDVPLGWVVTRSILYCFADGGASLEHTESLVDMVRALVKPAGLLVTEEDVQKWLEEEVDFQKTVTGNVMAVPRKASSGLLPALGYLHHLGDLVAQLRDLMAQRDTEVVQLQRLAHDRDLQLVSLESAVKDRVAQVESLNEALDAERILVRQSARAHDSLLAQLTSIKDSQSWRLTMPLRFVKHRLIRVLAVVPPRVRMMRNWFRKRSSP